MKFIIDLQGRFGNQLFQIAAGKFLESLGSTVFFDSSNDLNVCEFKVIDQLDRYVESRRLHKNFIFKHKLEKARRLGQRLVFGPRRRLVDYSGPGPDLTKLNSSRWMIGYWQQIQNATALVEELKENFKSEISEPADVTRIHIRRGDFDHLGLSLSLDWYKSALEVFDENVFNSRLEFVSDSPIKNIENKFQHFDFIIKSSDDFFVDFVSLLSSSRLIISRSSFSWWAASISNALVVAPSPWYSSEIFDPLILRKEWKLQSTRSSMH